jgi:hypothetical protein
VTPQAPDAKSCRRAASSIRTPPPKPQVAIWSFCRNRCGAPDRPASVPCPAR